MVRGIQGERGTTGSQGRWAVSVGRARAGRRGVRASKRIGKQANKRGRQHSR